MSRPVIAVVALALVSLAGPDQLHPGAAPLGNPEVSDLARSESPGEGVVSACSMCQTALEVCLERAAGILDACLSRVGDAGYCSDLHFELSRSACHEEDVDCRVCYCSRA